MGIFQWHAGIFWSHYLLLVPVQESLGWAKLDWSREVWDEPGPLFSIQEMISWTILDFPVFVWHGFIFVFLLTPTFEGWMKLQTPWTMQKLQEWSGIVEETYWCSSILAFFQFFNFMFSHSMGLTATDI